MSYSRTEYHKEEDRTNQDRDSGWRSWFGLGSNKDRDDGYSYSRTTTYRDADRDQPRGQYSGYSGNVDRYSSQQQYGDRDRAYGYSAGVSGQYGGERGGYGYQTTGERYPSGQQYGQQYGGQFDRDVNRDGSYYRAETRTYGGDRDYPRYGGDSQRYGGISGDVNVRSSYGQDRSPSRGFGFSGDYSSSRYGGDYQRQGQLGQGDYSYRQSYTSDRERPSYGDSSRYGAGLSGGYSSSYRY